MIKFSYFSERCKKLNEEIQNDIPLILERIDTYKDLTPSFRLERTGPYLFEDEILSIADRVRKIDGFNPYLLDNNLKSVTAGRMRKIHSGDYDIITNKIRIGSKDSLPHEVIHMGSSFYERERDIIVSGFSYVEDGIMIGRQFTEGYTELLTQEHFPNESYIPSYEYFVKYTKLFRDSFPNINMNKHYSKASLYNLLEDISKLGISREEAMTYIYLLGRFKMFNFSLIEGYLNEYLQDFKEKVKRIK